MTHPRLYHSTAVLLPDGRVFSAGSDGSTTADFYSPPYLFKGPRPTISNAPLSVIYGQGFSIDTPDTASITRVTMIRLSSVTHAFNPGQAFSQLNYLAETGRLLVAAPGEAYAAPPGYYMLFILNTVGVPSMARMINLQHG